MLCWVSRKLIQWKEINEHLVADFCFAFLMNVSKACAQSMQEYLYMLPICYILATILFWVEVNRGPVAKSMQQLFPRTLFATTQNNIFAKMHHIAMYKHCCMLIHCAQMYVFYLTHSSEMHRKNQLPSVHLFPFFVSVTLPPYIISTQYNYLPRGNWSDWSIG